MTTDESARASGIAPPALDLCIHFANTLSWRGRPHPAEGLKSYDRLVDWSLKVGALEEAAAERLRAEARRLEIPIVAMVDTNADPDEVTYPIPANDDAIRAVRLICERIADAVNEGRMMGAAGMPGMMRLSTSAVGSSTTSSANRSVAMVKN